MAIEPAIGSELPGGGLPAGFEGPVVAPGLGPYQLAWRRLRRNRVALAFGGLFVAIVVMCLLAPVYAQDIAHTSPDANHITETIKVGSKSEEVVSAAGIPIGPTWHARFFLGADQNGRDVAVRLLYGGRNSLFIGAVATLITMLLAVMVGLVSGYFRGPIDGVLSRLMDVIWAYPALLLGVALGVVLAVSGLNLGLFQIQGNSLLVPAVIVGVVYVPYVAKPLRGQVLGLREKEFIDASRAQGLGHLQIMLGEVLPNLASTIVVLVPLMLANSILLEASLSFLGAGVQPPNPSWGTMIGDGIRFIPAAIHTTLVPGIMLMLTVLGVNVLGDGVRDAFDPRARIRVER